MSKNRNKSGVIKQILIDHFVSHNTHTNKPEMDILQVGEGCIQS
jgi:hypothetical protein